MASVLPNGKQSFETSTGAPLVGGRLYTYAAGTNTLKATFADAAETAPNTNPVILDARGEATVFWSGSYKAVLRDSLDVVIWTVDGIAGNVDAASLLALDLASTSAATKGAGQLGFSYAQNYVVATLGWSVRHVGIDITQHPYLADKTGVASSSAAIAAAIAAFPGVPLYAPAGIYRLDTEVAYVTSSAGVFTAGFQINGAGSNSTIFDTRVANGFAFRCATSIMGTFQHTVKFSNLQITTLASPVVAGGISLRSCYTVTMEDVWVKGLSGDGVRVIMSNGDQDGSNMITLRNVRLENCLGWGFNTLVTGAFNEVSFLRFEQVFIQGCGTSSATVPPTSGGMRWKGQIFVATGSAWVICQNVGLYIQGGAGLSNTAALDACTFENNFKKGLYCDGIDGFTMTRGQFYNNDGAIAQNGAQFVGTVYSVRGVDIDGTIIRATSGNNAYTAFSITGPTAALDTCRVRGTIWQNFDSVGQTRFSGWQFDPIAIECALVALSPISLVLRPEQSALGIGNKMPIRLRGSGAAPSTSGEWAVTQLATSGVSISNAGLVVSTRYYCYLYDNGGAPALELSTTVFATDANSGYSIKTGDATRLYVGSVLTDPAAAFFTINTGWLNPTPIAGQQVGTFIYMWYSGTSAAPRYRTGVLPTSDVDGNLV